MGTIKLSTLIGQSQADIIKAINQDIIQPWHDCADSEFRFASSQSISADTEYRFNCNGLVRNVKNLPSHITELWDTSSSKTFLSEVQDAPVYVARVQFNFIPDTSTEGVMQFRAYINEHVPVLIQQIRNTFKKVDSRMEALFAFYVGAESGYDIKNNGLFFAYESSVAGKVYDRGILIYKT